MNNKWYLGVIDSALENAIIIDFVVYVAMSDLLVGFLSEFWI